MRVLRGALWLAVAVVSASLTVQAQPANTARPVKPRPIQKWDYMADDVPVAMFVIFGGASVGPNAPGADPSTVNVAQVTRTLEDVVAFRLPVSGVVSLGGLVDNGLADGGKAVSDRLAAWRKLYTGSQAKFPFHFVLGSEANGPNGAADNAAVAAVRALTTKEGWSPVAESATGLDFALTKERQRLVFLDLESRPSPDLAWLAKELAAADSDKRIQNVFVFGSKPLATPSVDPLPSWVQPTVSSTWAVDLRKSLRSSKKLAGYFCGSPALYNVTPLEKGSKVMQVVAGNGGGPLVPGWKPAGYGFSILLVFTGGRSAVYPFFREPPQNGQPHFLSTPEKPKSARPGKETFLSGGPGGGS